MRYFRIRNWNGAITAEASIVLPVVIVTILPFIFLLNMLLGQAILEHALDGCMKEIAAELYVLKRASIWPENEETIGGAEVTEEEVTELSQLLDEYTSWLNEEVWKEKLESFTINVAGQCLLYYKLKEWLGDQDLTAWGIQDGWDGISLSESEFLYTQDGQQHLIKGVISFEWTPLFSFWSMDEVTIQRVYHAFVGEETIGNHIESDDEESDSSVTVYRIGEGIKYHKLSCYLIQKNVFSTTKKQAQQSGLLPCSRCAPEGSVMVYRTTGGGHYHTSECSYLYPDLTAITLEEAKKAGYTGCGLCQKENGYFS